MSSTTMEEDEEGGGGEVEYGMGSDLTREGVEY